MDELAELNLTVIRTLVRDRVNVRLCCVLIALTQACRLRGCDVTIRRNAENELAWLNTRGSPGLDRGLGTGRWLCRVLTSVAKGCIRSRVG